MEDAASLAATEFSAFLHRYVDERRAKPADDLITHLIAAEQDGERLTTDELITTCILLLNAGHEATVHTIGNGVKTLLQTGLGITEDTIVMYSTDNGPHMNSWPDAGMTPFRNEKNSNWEGAYRVPAMIRWPGKVKPGEVSTQMFSGMDWFPTLLAAVGDTDIKDRLLKGADIGGKNFKVHLDGYNQLDYLTGKTDKSARTEFYYFNDDGELVSMRYNDWKLVFCEQRAPGGLKVWSEPFTCLRVPKLFNLRMDPYERADVVSDQYYDWLTKNDYLIFDGVRRSAAFLQTFVDYPPSQRPASFSIDQVRAEVDKKIAEKMKQQYQLK